MSAEVLVAILHAEAGPGAGPLTRATADARRVLAERHASGFLEDGATRTTVVAGPPVIHEAMLELTRVRY